LVEQLVAMSVALSGSSMDETMVGYWVVEMDVNMVA
jgi:hypothetical protein